MLINIFTSHHVLLPESEQQPVTTIKYVWAIMPISPCEMIVEKSLVTSQKGGGWGWAKIGGVLFLKSGLYVWGRGGGEGERTMCVSC